MKLELKASDSPTNLSIGKMIPKLFFCKNKARYDDNAEDYMSLVVDFELDSLKTTPTIMDIIKEDDLQYIIDYYNFNDKLPEGEITFGPLMSTIDFKWRYLPVTLTTTENTEKIVYYQDMTIVRPIDFHHQNVQPPTLKDVFKVEEPLVGKLYASSHKERRNGKFKTYRLVVMCTGSNPTSLKTFSGVVVENTDNMSDFKTGDYSTSWTWNGDVFKEFHGNVKLNNKNWKPNIEISVSQG